MMSLYLKGKTMTDQELILLEEIDKAEITEKGIKFSKYPFNFKDKKMVDGKEVEITVSRFCEKLWLVVEDGRTYVSHQGKDHFMAICFNKDMDRLKKQSENLRAFLTEQMSRSCE
jgi:hypothetical protein